MLIRSPRHALELAIQGIFCDSTMHRAPGETVRRMPPEVREQLKKLTTADVQVRIGDRYLVYANVGGVHTPHRGRFNA